MKNFTTDLTKGVLIITISYALLVAIMMMFYKPLAKFFTKRAFELMSEL